MLREIDKMSQPNNSGSSSGSSGGKSEFSINHRKKVADPSCELCLGQGYTETPVTKAVTRTCGDCSGTGLLERRSQFCGIPTLTMKFCLNCGAERKIKRHNTTLKRQNCDCRR